MSIKSVLTKQIAKQFQNTTFMGVNSTPALNFDTKNPEGYRIQVIIDDGQSPYYLESVSIKVKNLSPSVPAELLEKVKAKRVRFENLKISVYNNDFIFSADDVILVKENRDAK